MRYEIDWLSTTTIPWYKFTQKKKVQFKGPVDTRVCDGWRWQRMLAVEACRVTWRGHQLWWPREETQSVQRQHPPRVWTLWPARHRTPAPAQSPGSVSPQSMMDCDDNHPGPDDNVPGLHSTPCSGTRGVAELCAQQNVWRDTVQSTARGGHVFVELAVQACNTDTRRDHDA